MTLDTLMLLEHLLFAQQLIVGDPDFDVMASRVLTAKDELRQAIEAAAQALDDEGASRDRQ